MNNICNIFNIPCKAPLGIAGNGAIYIVLLLYKIPSPPLPSIIKYWPMKK